MFRPICSTCQRLSTVAAASVLALGSAAALIATVAVAVALALALDLVVALTVAPSRRLCHRQLHAAHVLSKLKDDKSTWQHHSVPICMAKWPRRSRCHRFSRMMAAMQNESNAPRSRPECDCDWRLTLCNNWQFVESTNLIAINWLLL